MSLVALLLTFVLCLGCGWAGASAFLSQPQAIQSTFPNERVERKTVFLTADQKKQIEALGGVKVDSSIVTYYVAHSTAGVDGIAFFDKRMVRTLPVTYMTVVKPSGAIDHVQILSFEEPDDYFPPAKWLDLFRNRVLNQDLALGHGIPHITGASLTSQAMSDGIRLILSTYEIAVKSTLS